MREEIGERVGVDFDYQLKLAMERDKGSLPRDPGIRDNGIAVQAYD